MDRTLVSGTEDLGSTPSGSATEFHLIKTWHRLFLGYYEIYEFDSLLPLKVKTRESPDFCINSIDELVVSSWNIMYLLYGISCLFLKSYKRIWCQTDHLGFPILMETLSGLLMRLLWKRNPIRHLEKRK